MTERSLERQKTDVRYFGFVPSDSFKDTLAAVRDMIYKSWDVSKESPPKQRPGSDAAEQAAPDLQILAWNGRPVFPECVASRFEEGTLEFDEVAKLKKEFLEMFPHATTQPAAPNPVPARVGGVCDFTLDNGAEPLDVNREIEVERIADDQFSEQRLLVMLIRVSVLVLCFKSRDAGWASLFCSFKEQGRVCPVFCWCGRRASTQMTKKRPAIVIAQDFSIWIGNTSEQSVTFEPGELLGFGTGAFEEKVISALAPIDRAE